MGRTLSAKKPDFQSLWTRLRAAYESAGRGRDVAVLDNFQNRKEMICRKLGVVCAADVDRVSARVAPR